MRRRAVAVEAVRARARGIGFGSGPLAGLRAECATACRVRERVPFPPSTCVRQSLRTNNECYALFRLPTVCSLRPEARCEEPHDS